MGGASALGAREPDRHQSPARRLRAGHGSAMAGSDPGTRPTSYSLRAVLIAYSFAVVLPIVILTGYLLNELAAADRAGL